MHEKNFHWSLLGLIMVILGSIFAMKNVGVISPALFNMVWPALMVILGFGLMVSSKIKNKNIKK